jgi:hypothetical protein
MLVWLGACDVGAVPTGDPGGTGPDAGVIGTGGGGGGGSGSNGNNAGSGSGSGAGSGSGTGSGGGGGGGQSFNAIIAPLVTRCTGCHGGGQSPTLTSFSALEPKYKVKPGASNILVIKGDATNGQHHGIQYFSATEKTTVANWIDSLP